MITLPASFIPISEFGAQLGLLGPGQGHDGGAVNEKQTVNLEARATHAQGL